MTFARPIRFALLLVCLSCASQAAEDHGPSLTTKVIETFEQSLWINSPWNTGAGQTAASTDAPAGCDFPGSMELPARFSGHGFETVMVSPPQTLAIPGELKSVSIRVKRMDQRYGLKMSFLDGQGREKADGHALDWDMPLKQSEDWQTCTFKVPATWVQPITINGIVTHNWETQSLSNTVIFRFAQLEATTDLHQAGPNTALLEASFATGVEGNVFAGEEPCATLRARNWNTQPLNGTFSVRVVDDTGNLATNQSFPFSVNSIAVRSVVLPAPKFGRYIANTAIAWSDGTRWSRSFAYAKLPSHPELSEVEKMASPYGLNVHSGEKIVIDPFKKAGIVWFREYAFQWDWILRAKGEDRRYAGWPYYTKIVGAYRDAGVKILPVIQKSLQPPVVENGKITRIGPDSAWTREMASLMLAFPKISHWELANEYDYPAVNKKLEERCGWANYRAYHRQFADILNIIGGPDKIAVESGRAGIWPKRVKDCVTSGDFAKIGVVNSHYYCGTSGPELSFENYNMGFDASEQQLGSLYDELRTVKHNSAADGRKRESWLTEFGWDTLAGPKVSPYEQAVFLPRAWMLAMAAGTGKAFWFYNFDAKEPKAFFDGCGLLSAGGEPKLSLCSLAGMTSILRNPRFVGSIDAGEGTWGYVFDSEGKHIAALWMVESNSGPMVHFQAEQLFDYLGNPLPGKSARLTMAPVYAVGLNENDPLWRQTAYSLKTSLFMGASAGDPAAAVLVIDNTRTETIHCQISARFPAGWSATALETSAQVAPGEKREMEFPFVPDAAASDGIMDARFTVTETGMRKEIPFRIMVQPALSLKTDAITGPPGPAVVTAEVANLSSRARDATLRVVTPQSWKVETPVVAVQNLQSGERRPVKLNLVWSGNWRPAESAFVELDGGVRQPIIPGQTRLFSVGGIKMDGNLHDWPAQNELPHWMLGCSHGPAKARIFLGWAKEGLYGEISVQDSRAIASDPKAFWACDSLEFFIDTGDNEPRHFWLAPLAAEGRAYVGQWKHGGEIPETRYDIPGLKTAVKTTLDGYNMEFLLPASLMGNFQPAPGKRLGFDLVLNVHGQKLSREVYWPMSKESGVIAHPENWGTMELSNSP